MDAAHHWPQEFVVKPIDEIVTNAALLCGGAPPPPGGGSHGKPLDNQSQQRKPRPQKEQAVNCPRCNSTNTKFCYYNNYSLTQPRYFCKTCRRYWTEGGSLRNIPVGGGSRKNKRPSSSSSSMSNISNTSNNSASSTSTTTSSSSISKIIGQNPSKSTQDLNLAFPPELLHLVPNNGGNNLERGLLSSFMSMPLSVADHHHHQSAVNNYTTAPPPPAGHGVFPSFHDIKPSTLSFSLDGLGIGGGSYRNAMSSSSGVPDSGRMFFPFEELKQQVSSSTSIGMEQSNNNHRGDHQQGSDHNSNGGYWSGMLGGGSW